MQDDETPAPPLDPGVCSIGIGIGTAFGSGFVGGGGGPAIPALAYVDQASIAYADETASIYVTQP